MYSAGVVHARDAGTTVHQRPHVAPGTGRPRPLPRVPGGAARLLLLRVLRTARNPACLARGRLLLDGTGPALVLSNRAHFRSGKLLIGWFIFQGLGKDP